MLLTELGKQRALRADFEKRLADLEAQKYRMAELEEQQARLAGENTMLKHMLAEARAKQDELTHKTEGVLKLLYHMFVSTVRLLSQSTISREVICFLLGWQTYP